MFGEFCFGSTMVYLRRTSRLERPPLAAFVSTSREVARTASYTITKPLARHIPDLRNSNGRGLITALNRNKGTRP